MRSSDTSSSPFRTGARLILAALFAASFAALLGGFGLSEARAQGTIQVNVGGLPGRLSTPYVEDLLRNYEAGRYPVQVFYSSPSAKPTAFRFRVTLAYEGNTILETTSDPVALEPGAHTYFTLDDPPAITFDDPLARLLRGIGGDVGQALDHSGALAEGTYALTIEAEPDDMSALVSSVPGQAVFSVEYAQPPVLFTPADGALVTQQTPVFSWTPVTAGGASLIDYTFRLVELRPGQTLQQAIEANQVYVERTLQQTTFTYTPDLLQLREGHTYVWEVVAQDQNEQLLITEGGRSQLHSFVYDPVGPPTGSGLNQLNTLVLEPGFARLTGLGAALQTQDLRAVETPFGYMINGLASLELTFPGGVTTVSVRLSDLELQSGDLTNPVLLSGTLSGGNLQGLTVPALRSGQRLRDLIYLQNLTWGFGRGFQMTGQILLPDGSRVDATGDLRVTRNGVQGQLVATGNGGSPLVALGSDPVAMRVDQLAAELPSGRLLADGVIEVFGQTLGAGRVGACTFSSTDLLASDLPLQFSCAEDLPSVSLFGTSDRLSLLLSNLAGAITADFGTGSFDYDLDALANLTLQTTATSPDCDFTFPISLSSATGVTVGQVPVSSCRAGGTLDLGVVQAEIRNAGIDRLSYTGAGSGADAWDGAFSLDLILTIPSLDLALPEIEDLTLDRNGLTIPQQQFADVFAADPAEPYTFAVAGYEITVEQFDLPRTTLPLFSWTDPQVAPWDFSFDADVDFPADSRVPMCLRNANLSTVSFQYQNDELAGSLGVQGVGPCSWDLGGGYALVIESIEGQIGMADLAGDDFTSTADVTLAGGLELGEPFTCDAPGVGGGAPVSRAMTFPSNERLRLYGNGFVEGTFENLIPPCPVAVGPLNAGVTASTLSFDYIPPAGNLPGAQMATFEAEATLSFPGGQNNGTVDVDGTLAVDLMIPELTALDFQMRQPFQWDVPANDPVLSFALQSASIGLDGFAVDGRQELLLGPNQTLGATFDDVLVDLETFELVRGQIDFDSSLPSAGPGTPPSASASVAFGLVAGIDPDGTLDYEAVPAGHTLVRNPGALLNLAGQVTIDPAGLHASGTASADLRFQQWGGQSAFGVEFTNDFLMGLSPFGVRRGRADLTYEQQRVAYIDPTGFNLAAGAVADVLPGRLPLPTEQVAYLELRQNGDPNGALLVAASDTPDGKLEIETASGRTVDLVVPALAANGNPAPRVTVAFDDFVLDPADGYGYESGLLTATVNDTRLDDLGLPMSLRTLTYGTVQDPQGQQETGLFASGPLVLFDEQVGSAEITVMVSQDRFTGAFDIRNIGESLEVGGGLGQLILAADSAGGTINVPHGGGAPAASVPAGVAVDVKGRLALYRTDGSNVIYTNDNELLSGMIDLRLSDSGIALNAFRADTKVDTVMADLGAVQFGVTGVDGLSTFSYDDTSGLDFLLDVDFLLALEAGPRTLAFPLHDVQISPNGFTLPARQINESTVPALPDTQRVALGPVELALYDVHLKQPTTVNWFDDPGAAISSLSSLNLSFVMNFPAYADLPEVTVTEAGFENGLFTGSADVEFLNPEPIPLGGGTAMVVDSVGGALINDGGRQGFAIDFGGTFELPDGLFGPPPPGTPCAATDVRFSLASNGGLEGTVTDFAACASFAYGPATITFPTSGLILSTDGQGEQQVVLDAQADATVPASVGSGVLTGSGTFEMDLVAGDIISASIGITGPFDYGLPANDPVFTMRIQQATINGAGFLIDGSGELVVPDAGGPQSGGDAGGGAPGASTANVSVDFDQFLIDPLAPAVVSGTATIASDFALRTSLATAPDGGLAIDWEVSGATADAAPGSDPNLLLELPANLTIDRDGLLVDGTTRASFSYADTTLASLDAAFNSFRVGLNPSFGVRSGHVDLIASGAAIARYDNNGFDYNPTGLILAVLPQKIPLPSTDIAYLRIKDDQDNLLVEYSPHPSGTGYLVSSPDADGDGVPDDSLDLVIPALGDPSILDGPGAAPRARVALSGLQIENGAIIGGSISAEVNEALLGDQDLPVRLTRLFYERANGSYALGADGTADLPEGFGGDDALTFTNVGFDPNGLTGIVEAGPSALASVGSCALFPTTYDTQSRLVAAAYTRSDGLLTTASQPALTDPQLGDAHLGITVRAFRFDLGAKDFKVIGDVSSRLTAEPGAAEPDRLPFVTGYDAISGWTGALCPDSLPDEEGGDGEDGISISIATLYLDDDNGGDLALNVQPDGDVNIVLSGTLKLQDVLGGDFGAVVKNLRLGSDGVSVEQAGGQFSGQTFDLFDDNFRIVNNSLAFDYDNGADALRITFSGEAWLVPYQCTDGDPLQCAPGAGAALNNFAVNTRGDVSLGSSTINLLPASGRIDVIGSGADAALFIDALSLEKPGGQPLALNVGGEAQAQDLMDGASADFDFQLTADGAFDGDAISVAFGDGSARLGDNAATEIAFGSVATMDVQEVGVAFEGGRLAQPAVFANGRVYVQNDVDSEIRFGATGNHGATDAGFYYSVASGVSFSAQSGAVLPDIDLSFFKVENATVGVAQSQGTWNVTLGGDLSVDVPGVTVQNAAWRGFTFNRSGLVSAGTLDAGGKFEVMGIASLEVGDINFEADGGQLTLNSFDPASGDADVETISTNAHFVLADAKLTVGTIVKGEVGEAYFIEGATSDGSRGPIQLGVLGAKLEVPTMTADASFFYAEAAQGGFEFGVSGRIALEGALTVGLQGSLAKNASGEVSFGLAASAFVPNAGIPIVPGILTANGVWGGFFYNPTSAMISQVEGTGSPFPSFNVIPEDKRLNLAAEAQNYKVAVYLGIGASVLGTGSTAVLQANAQLSFFVGSGSVAMELLVEGEFLDRPELMGGLAVNFKTGGGTTEVNGVGIVQVNADPAAAGVVSVGFSAIDDGSRVAWAVEATIGGTGDDGPFEIAAGLLEATGSLLICDSGTLFDLAIGTGFDVWVVAIRADMEMSAWMVRGTDNYGAYFMVGINASLFGGLAELGAEVKGAYINRDKLFYGAATGYLSVFMVFEGNVTVWLAMENGSFDAGRGTNGRYDAMIASARADAANMQAAADQAISALSEAQSVGFQFSEEAIQNAGLQMVSATAAERAQYQSVFLGNENSLDTPVPYQITQVANSVLGQGARPSYGGYLAARRASVQQDLSTLTANASAVSQELSNLTVQAVTWDENAAQLSRELSNPVGAVSGLQTTGSGDDKQVVGTASFVLDETQATQQEQALATLKDEVDALDARYREAIADVAVNLNKLSGIMDGRVVVSEIDLASPASSGGNGSSGNASNNQNSGQFMNQNSGQLISQDGVQPVYQGAALQAVGTQPLSTSYQVTTTVNQVAKDYAQLTAEIRSLYATRADSLWRTEKWASDQYTRFATGPLRESVMRNAIQGQTSGSTPLSKIENTGWGRCRFIALLQFDAPGDDYTRSDRTADYANCYNEFRNVPPSSTYPSQARQRFVDHGVTLWHETPEQGLRIFADSLQGRAEKNSAKMYQALAPVMRNHRSLTAAVDTLYAVKASLTTTLYGMLEEYLAFREETFGAPAEDAGRTPYDQQRIDLLRHLQPPAIYAVKVNRPFAQPGFKSSAQVEYDAWHPKEVVEASYNVTRGGGTNIYAGDNINRTDGSFYTMGDEGKLTYNVFKEARDQQTQTLSVAIRVRGTGGNVATRRVLVPLTVDLNGPGNTGNMGDQLVADTTPPSVTVGLPYRQADVAKNSGPGASSALGYSQAYWTVDPSQMRFSIIASDAESDIRKYEYAIGTTKGATDVAGWSTAVGRRDLAGRNTGGMANLSFQGIARGLAFDPYIPYYVSVRVSNGELMSTVKEIGTPLVFDPSAPSQPEATPTVAQAYMPMTMTLFQNQSTSSGSPQWVPAALDEPVYRGPVNGARADAERTVSWQRAVDRESGIDFYEYAVADTGEVARDVFGDPDRVGRTSSGTTTELTLDPEDGLSYLRPKVVYVRAVNHAGARGAARRLDVGTLDDATAPNAPEIAARLTPNGLRLYLTRPASDYESSIQGYRYRIESYDGASWTTVRDFPSQGVDFFPPCGQRFTSYVLPDQGADASSRPAPSAQDEVGCEYQLDTRYGTPLLHVAKESLPSNTKLFVSVRAVNYQGDVSRIASSGSKLGNATLLVFDDTPPPAPTLESFTLSNLGIGQTGGAITATLRDVHDPESGVAKVEVAVRDPNRSGSGNNWLDFAGGSMVSRDYVAHSIYPSSPLAPFGSSTADLQLGVRVTNTNGQQTVVWSGPTLQIQEVASPLTLLPGLSLVF